MPKQLDFIAVGPFKTGTSWIHDYLLNYQGVVLPDKVKETFFFDRKFDKGFDWYFSHFSELSDNRLMGEISPSYFHSIEASQRIFDCNPECKILVTLREPVSRMFSFYSHMIQRGQVNPKTSFTEALSEKKILPETSLYYSHLSRWIETFGKDNVKVIFFETLKESPDKFAAEVLDRLEIKSESIDYDLDRKVNASIAPVNHNASKIVYSGVKILHDLGLHKIVEYGKKIGIKQILTTNKSQKARLSQDEFISAFNLCRDDVLKLESELNFDLSFWKAIWSEKGININ